MKKLLIILFFIGCTVPQEERFSSILAPVQKSRTAQETEQTYIVGLKKGKSGEAVAKRHGVKAKHQLRFYTFSGSLTPGQLKKLIQDPDVAYIEPDAEAKVEPTLDSLIYQPIPPGVKRIGGGGENVTDTSLLVLVLDTGADPGHPDLNITGGTIGSAVYQVSVTARRLY